MRSALALGPLRICPKTKRAEKGSEMVMRQLTEWDVVKIVFAVLTVLAAIVAVARAI